MKILSIDGGGVRGIIPGMVIAEIESRTGKPVSELFDLISGTSAGGHLALALSLPAENGKPRWSAAALADFYGPAYGKIFDSSRFKMLDVIKGLAHERYSSNGIEGVLEELFGEAMLSDALTEVLITAYEVERAEPHFFTRHDARTDPRNDHFMRFVARATSAAPTYFEPAARLESPDKLTFIDGGVFANNPTMCAFAHAQSLGFDEDDMTIVSLGTGAVSRSLQFEEVREWGLASWARPIIDISAHAGNHAIDWQMTHILRPENYFRLTPSLASGRTSLDDARPETISALEAIAKNLIEENSATIDVLCESIG